MEHQKQLKVLFAASELALLAKVGGLGDVIESLPKTLKKMGVDVRIIMPRYEVIDKNKAEFIKDIKVRTGDGSGQKVSVYLTHISGSEVEVYLLDNEKYLSGGGIYMDRSAFVSQFQEVERFLFFCMAAAEFMKSGVFQPDIVHCHDWHTGFLMHLLEKHKTNSQTVFTIHNLANQGVWNKKEVFDFLFGPAGHSQDFYSPEGNNINLMAEGIINCDLLTTVSPTYAKEITTKEYGEGLEDIIKKKKKDLAGIVNGIDTEFFNSQKNPHINHFDDDDLGGKENNKKFLQEKFGLKKDLSIPLLSVVSRLTYQKGMDLLLTVTGQLVDRYGAQLVVLGRGDPKIENEFLQLQKKYPLNVAIDTEFSEEVANKIYGGSDIILIPSKFEPCGLTQMIANAYGTIPVVRKTGGLADTIEPYKNKKGIVLGNGFVFEKYEAAEFLKEIERALDVYLNKKDNWQSLIKNAMKKDFSWDVSAKEYLDVYKKLIR
jgi:starch synthase